MPKVITIAMVFPIVIVVIMDLLFLRINSV